MWARTMPDGQQYIDHLRAASRAVVVDELRPLPIPPGCDELLAVYIQLHRAGRGTVTLESIAAWQSLHNTNLNSWEVDTILEMDSAHALETQKWQQQLAKS